MNVLIVDDELLAIERVKSLLGDYSQVGTIHSLQDSSLVIRLLRKEDIQVVFLDINMPEVSGMDVAKEIRRHYDDIDIVFVTGYENYALEAFEVEAVDYLVKPIRRQRFSKTMQRLIQRHIPKAVEKRVRINTFGRFECFVQEADNQIHQIKWRTRKAKELFAYLVDNHDKHITRDMIIDTLWHDFDNVKASNNLNSNIYYVKKELTRYGLDSALSSDKKHITFSINSDEIDLDVWHLENWISTRKETDGKRALEVIKGDYFEEEDYHWSTLKKNAYRLQYEMLVDEVVLKSSHDELDIELYINITNQLPYKEDVFYIMIKKLKKEGHLRTARQYYEQLVSNLQVEFDCYPKYDFDAL